MDSTEQKMAEKRVREILIEPLERRGLARPASLTRVQFEAMVADLCARLAYMSPANLAALEEQVAANPAGKDRDRLPIGNKILDWAAMIQPPEESVSPLMRAVFASRIGREALAEGWAPELLGNLRRVRQFPGAFAASQIRSAADEARRRMIVLEERLAAGQELHADDRAWHARRQAALAKCHEIAALAGEVA
jgi:hypothetical protein